MKRKIFLALIFLFFAGRGKADLHFVELQSWENDSGVKKIKREFWLKKNLLRIDRKDSSLTYLYNLHNNSLVILDRKKNKFAFFDWESLRRKLSEVEREKIQLLKKEKKISPKKSWLVDPFGLEPLFYCPGNRFEISPGKSPGKYLIHCQSQLWAEVWIEENFPSAEEWSYYLSNLRFLNLSRYRLFYLLPGFPEKITGKKEKVSYQYQEISFQPISLEIFLIPESAQPDLE